jgi:hypothetical protein
MNIADLLSRNTVGDNGYADVLSHDVEMSC